jgi:hypothetical protein
MLDSGPQSAAISVAGRWLAEAGDAIRY